MMVNAKGIIPSMAFNLVWINVDYSEASTHSDRTDKTCRWMGQWWFQTWFLFSPIFNGMMTPITFSVGMFWHGLTPPIRSGGSNFCSHLKWGLNHQHLGYMISHRIMMTSNMEPNKSSSFSLRVSSPSWLILNWGFPSFPSQKNHKIGGIPIIPKWYTLW